MAEHLLTAGRSRATSSGAQLPIAGDVADARRSRGGLVASSGSTSWTPVPSDSWRQQPGTPVYGAEAGVEGITQALADAPTERPADFRG